MTVHVDVVANLLPGTNQQVGGRLTVSDHAVEFRPSTLNRAVSGDATTVVPLQEIGAVDVEGALFAKRLRIRGRGGDVVVHCHRARDVAATIRRLAGVA